MSAAAKSAAVKAKARRTPRRRGRPRSGTSDVVHREKVLEAALDVFADLGFEGTSVLKLGRQLGVSHSLLHARFGSKRELWQAVVDHCLEQLRARSEAALRDLGPDATPTERFRAATNAFLVALAGTPSLLKLMNYEGARSSDRLAYIADGFLASGFGDFRRSLEEGIETGEFRRDVSPATVFLLICHGGGAYLCLRSLGSHLGLRSRRSEETLRAQAEEITELVLRAILA
jgi:AcrR family transcriptional regulator